MMKDLIKKLKYLYRTNWIIRFTVHFALLYAMATVMLLLIHYVFGAMNSIMVVCVLFLIALGVTAFLRKRDG